MSKKNSNAGSVFIAILSIMLVVAVVAFIFKFTNGLNEDLKTFYIEHNGKQIVATDSQMTFDTDSEHRFDCKYISNPDNNTFNLKVVPNVTEETDFSYTVDGKSHKWSEVEDLTSCFNLDKQANYFIVSFPVDFSMQGVLNSLYPESQVVISDTLSLYQYYYTLHVSNYNEKINYYIDFNVCDVLDYVTLINEQIETIAQLDDKIDNLENQIAELETSSGNKDAQIADLQKQIIAKEVLIDEYVDILKNLESEEKVVATFIYDNDIYAVQVYDIGETIEVINPENIDGVIFNGWKINDEFIDLSSYVIIQNTTFIADLSKKCVVNFYVGDNLLSSQELNSGDTISIPSVFNGKVDDFLGWSIDGKSIVEIPDCVSDSVNYYAIYKFSSLDLGIYKAEDSTLLYSFQELFFSGNFDKEYNPINGLTYAMLSLSNLFIDDNFFIVLRGISDVAVSFTLTGENSGSGSLEKVVVLDDYIYLTANVDLVPEYVFAKDAWLNLSGESSTAAPFIDASRSTSFIFDMQGVSNHNPMIVLGENLNVLSGSNYFGKYLYLGSKTDWASVVSDLNGDFVYFYSETLPTSEGQYWHYIDGVPTIW